MEAPMHGTDLNLTFYLSESRDTIFALQQSLDLLGELLLTLETLEQIKTWDAYHIGRLLATAQELQRKLPMANVKIDRLMKVLIDLVSKATKINESLVKR